MRIFKRPLVKCKPQSNVPELINGMSDPDSLQRRLYCSSSKKPISTVPLIKKKRVRTVVPPLSIAAKIERAPQAIRLEAAPAPPPSVDVAPPSVDVSPPVIEVAPPSSSARAERNPRVAQVAKCRVEPPDEDEIPKTARQGTKQAPGWTARITKDFAEWKNHRLYTPVISETEWKDRNQPFWFVWQFNALDLKKEFV